MATKCKIWSGAKDKDGYGVARMPRGRKISAHRKSWIEHNGPIPEGIYVLHHCDNPPCYEISHLYLGDQKRNIRDCISRGRWVTVRGEKHYSSKFSDHDVDKIKKLVAQGHRQSEVAKIYKVDPSTICKIVHGQRRKVSSK